MGCLSRRVHHPAECRGKPAWVRRAVPSSPDGGPDRTVLSLVSTDRPGLLADVARVLRQQRLRVHDARIATFGARVEDVFQITDEHDRAVSDPARHRALRDALLACLQGDSTQ